MKFSELVKHEVPDLEISKRHEDWLQRNANPVYSDDAVEFAKSQFAAKPRNRKGTISASSLDSCRRRQMFTFLGMPEMPPSPKSAQILQNGMFVHVRWQMAGLTEGWLLNAEVPVGDNPLRLSGTLDGVSDLNSVVELKSINSNGYRGVNQFGVKKEHKFQVGTYMVTTGREKALVIYENKDTNEFKEIPVHLTKELENDVVESANRSWDYADSQNLPDPIEECMDQKGWRFNSCPFRKACVKARSWKDAEEIREQTTV